LLGACGAAYLISFFLMKGSIMTEKIRRRGVHTPDAYEPDVLQTTQVATLMTAATGNETDHPFVFATDDAGLAAEVMGRHQCDTLTVLDKRSKQPVGIITTAAIIHFYSSRKRKDQQYASPGRTRRLMVRGRNLVRKRT